jgi:hypothetical protein
MKLNEYSAVIYQNLPLDTNRKLLLIILLSFDTKRGMLSLSLQSLSYVKRGETAYFVA